MIVRLSGFARTDLQEIASYIARDSTKHALATLQRLRQEFGTIAANPYLFRLRPELGPDLRLASVGRYVILFRIEADTVYLERVLHAMHDLPHQFNSGYSELLARC